MRKEECAGTLAILRKSNRFEIRAHAFVPGLPRLDGAATENGAGCGGAAPVRNLRVGG